LDQVVGGAGAPPPPVKDEHVVDHVIAPPVMAPHVTLAPSTPMIDHTQTTAAVAATELTHGQLDAQHAIAQVEAYDAGHGIAAVSGLTDLLNSSNANHDVATALNQMLHS